MHSVDYDQILLWLQTKELPYIIPTLGRRSYILVSIIEGQLHIQGRQGAETIFTRAYWEEICQIIDRVEPARREITTEYQNAPVYRFAPSVPTICRQYCLENER